MNDDRDREVSPVEKMTGRELREQALDGLPLMSSGYSISIAASADLVSRQIYSWRDIAVIDAVSDRLGRDDWTAHEIRERLIFQVQEGVTTVTLDGRPIAKFAEPTFEVERDGTQSTLKAKQRFLECEGGAKAVTIARDSFLYQYLTSREICELAELIPGIKVLSHGPCDSAIEVHDDLLRQTREAVVTCVVQVGGEQAFNVIRAEKGMGKYGRWTITSIENDQASIWWEPGRE